MIPALLAVPVVGSIVGSVAGTVAGQVANVANCLSPSAPSGSGPSSFTPCLNQATAATAPARSATTSPIGTVRADQWSQLGKSDLQTWMKSLAGRHVDATDETGRTISGLVGGMQQVGSTLALNIGGHLVSLSQLKHISWSPSTV